MIESKQVLKQAKITAAQFKKFREFGLVNSYVEKRPIPKKGRGFQYLYTDVVVQQIKEVKDKVSKGISLSEQKKNAEQIKRSPFITGQTTPDIYEFRYIYHRQRWSELPENETCLEILLSNVMRGVAEGDIHIEGFEDAMPIALANTICQYIREAITKGNVALEEFFGGDIDPRKKEQLLRAIWELVGKAIAADNRLSCVFPVEIQGLCRGVQSLKTVDVESWEQYLKFVKKLEEKGRK